MKNIYFYVALLVVSLNTALHLNSYSIAFKNQTNETLYLQGKAKYSQDNGKNVQTYNYSNGTYETQYQVHEEIDSTDFKTKIAPSSMFKWQYAKTWDVNEIRSISFSVMESSDPYALALYTCDNRNHKSINNKILYGKHWYNKMPENCSITFTKNNNGEITASYSK